jgi:hypothetical protein
MNKRKATMISLVILLLGAVAISDGLAAAPVLPNPQIVFAGTEDYQAGGQQWVRYNLRVLNLSVYPDTMFAAAPYLPPCGNNANASRTWVDVYAAGTNKRLYGFCALGSAQGLDELWFAMKKGAKPPRSVYIVMTDRRAKKVYKSNVVATQ